jgi:pimeloyl-ACP methyl ester carboxylesterase
VYDTWDHITKKVDRTLAMAQPLTRIRPFAWLLTGNVRRLFPHDTYQTMLAEDFNPAGIAQTRSEMQAVAAAIPRFRAQPPRSPKCPTILLSAARGAKGWERQRTVIREHHRRYAESLPDGRFESVDSAHLVMAEQPQLVADRAQRLLHS